MMQRAAPRHRAQAQAAPSDFINLEIAEIPYSRGIPTSNTIRMLSCFGARFPVSGLAVWVMLGLPLFEMCEVLAGPSPQPELSVVLGGSCASSTLLVAK